MDRRVDLFRRIALSLPGTAESSHMDHPDFRLEGRIFATLSAQGMTFVHLKEADESLISGALQTAYHNLQKKPSDKKSSRTAKPVRPSH